jgi:cytochrome c peroxidase
MKLTSLLSLGSLIACSADHRAAELGSKVFFDPALSHPAGQACADCHAPNVAFRDPESDRSTSAGVLHGRFGVRNAPTLMYARYVPELHLDPYVGWAGGLFWDGRGGTLEHQAAFPMLNPVEMNNPDRATVVEVERHANYAGVYRALYGNAALDDVDTAFAHVGEVLAAFERTAALSPFSSKYDRFIAGDVKLTASEQRGLTIFDAHCASCHPPPLFTNFSYANLGIPRYANNAFYKNGQDLNPAGDAYVDHGLGTIVHDPAQDGKFRVPTLRNIARTAPYGHNGYFANLPYMLDFLNTRDSRSPDPLVKPWAPPEVAANVEQRVGHLGLSPRDLDDLDNFLETLTDKH